MKSIVIGLAASIAFVAAPSAQIPGTKPARSAASGANPTLTAIDGLKVGSHTLAGGTTGCTVILVGGGTHPGSGLPVIFESARISSRLLLKDLGREAPVLEAQSGYQNPIRHSPPRGHPRRQLPT